MFTLTALTRLSPRYLTTAWMGLLVGSFLFVLSVTLGILFRSTRWWRIAVVLIIATLLLVATAAWMDRLGYAR